MKLSLAWIFDHIDADWHTVDKEKLVARFNESTAEIEAVVHNKLDLRLFSLVLVRACSPTAVTVYSAEWQQELSLPLRPDATPDALFLVKKSNGVSWVTGKDFGSSKEFLMPAVHCAPSMIAGGWKHTVEAEDYLLDIDNKSITHRPDLWGHRGIAREVAVLLGLPLKPLELMTADLTFKEFDTVVSQSVQTPFALSIQNSQVCRRFAGLVVTGVINKPSDIAMAWRLAKVEAKPINALVDATNYCMFDLGHPMHAFDAARIPTKKIEVQYAHAGHKLGLLDGQTIDLTVQDLVITDGKQPLALAGIMGGSSTGVTMTTHSLFLEAAVFDAAMIRQTAARHKIRTQASARFEKSLDPQEVGVVLARYCKLLSQLGIAYTVEGVCALVGARPKPVVIEVAHEFIEKRLGISLTNAAVVKILQALGCAIVEKSGIYTVTIPSWRSAKDLRIPEDLVEEVGRIVGYSTVPVHFPTMQMHPTDLTKVNRVRMLKDHCAYAMAMHEVATYALYDEQFLREIAWEPSQTLTVHNPVSENWVRLVSSLIPNLFKGVSENKADYDSIRLFEWARVWSSSLPVSEKRALAGVVYEQKKEVDFYDIKALLTTLFDRLNLSVSYEKIEQPRYPWYMPYQTARIMYDTQEIGIIGKVHPAFMQKVAEGDAVLFELDGDFLLTYKPPHAPFHPLSKYPDTVRDVSLLVPLNYTVDTLIVTLMRVDSRVKKVELIDFFENPAWKEQRSVTLRFTMNDTQATLTKAQADEVYEAVVQVLQRQGAVVRT